MITDLAVKNYRSLKDTKLSLGPLTVLIGANGSGKSNILDVLRLVQQLVAEGQQTTSAFASRGGYKEVVWGGDPTANIAIDLDWRPGASSKAAMHAYSALLGYEESADAIFSAENLVAPGEETFERISPDRWVQGSSSGSVESVQSAVYTERIRRQLAPDLMEAMHDWVFYRFNPASMRQPQQVRKEYRVTESGHNLSTVVHTLFSDEDPVLDEIVDLLKACVPTVQELRSPITEDGRTYVALKEQSLPAPVGSWGLSDGTLFVLALATALLTPKPPILLVLEAPDTELHPHVMETLAEMLKLASTKTQVIATTHSPYLLDSLPPESFVVVEKTKGATQCRPLKGRRGVKRLVKELGLGRAWYSGHIGGVP